MDRIRTAAQKLWFRVATLAVVAFCLVLVVMPPDIRTGMTLVLARAAGWALPAIALGAGAGWLFYSRQVWLWSTVAFGILTFYLGMTYGPLH